MTEKIEKHPDAKALIFDCDGTLADNEDLHLKAWQQGIAKWGHRFSREFLVEMSGIPTRETIKEFNHRYGSEIDPEEFFQYKEKLANKILDHCKPFADTVALVNKYYKILPMAVVSGGIAMHVHKTLEVIGIEDKFQCILTADTPVAPKPSPDIFLMASKDLGVEPQYCQVFEDAIPGIEGAKQAGMLWTNVRELRIRDDAMTMSNN